MKQPYDILETERLALRRFTRDDLPWLTELNGDAEVMRYIDGPMSPEATRDMLEGRILRYYDEHPGLGMWVTYLRDGGEIVGSHLLNHIRGETPIQVGYRLFPRAWGKGYATEMSVALLEYGYTRLKLPTIVAITDLGNVDSQHVLLKSGLHRKGERRFAAYSQGAPLAWFERDAAAWLAERRGGV